MGIKLPALITHEILHVVLGFPAVPDSGAAEYIQEVVFVACCGPVCSCSSRPVSF